MIFVELGAQKVKDSKKFKITCDKIIVFISGPHKRYQNDLFDVAGYFSQFGNQRGRLY